jgi:hypothetical protein
MGMLEDKTVQMKGICVVSTRCSGPHLMALPSSMSAMSTIVACGSDISSSLPVRVVGDHVCYDAVRLQYIVFTIRTAFGKSLRLRIHTHFGKPLLGVEEQPFPASLTLVLIRYTRVLFHVTTPGSPIEVQYSILTFGLDWVIPLFSDKNDDNKRRKLQRDYIENCRHVEQQAADDRETNESASGIIAHPNTNEDVIVHIKSIVEIDGLPGISTVLILTEFFSNAVTSVTF